MGQPHRRVVTGVALLALLPAALAGCGLTGGDDSDGGTGSGPPQKAPAAEAAAKSRERVQAYLDAMVAKDVDAGRSQLCAPAQAAFDAGATGPNGDFADHFTVPHSTITDVRSGPHGQEVSTAVTVAVGTRKATRPLLFTVTRSGADWCIAGEAPGGNAPEPATTP
ncbi:MULTISPECIES: hypothetical protein [Micromonospora]|uniref:Lipoprotein n=1 Tax=Micromonospora solifontis TaxID=2487138 RepID=A0ABX9WEE9_9ACTN|nr:MULTISPECIES: hypothetical protein [Micromonospora]NES12307.1 hypothetical protein [Micromonospora sp. PPF5-17B]NES37790.1 hypothetical protein [Micromonospora solifontis]NES54210.1 hypothetical protein [Micromonospora sp. PPF5-6]RNL97982.1 hypothetical protein EFE23_16785 [Micromonospora solifontis]